METPVVTNMAKRILLAVGIVSIISTFATVVFLKWRPAMAESSPSKLRVGFPAPWGSLDPALQHTRFADALMGNVYEPLVRNRLGRIEPASAKSWTVSDDRKTYTFQIDTERRFSNGEHLTAQHFKTSWEAALKKRPKSSNASLIDVLYKTKGFESFEKTGVLEGVLAKADDTLVVEFAAPFRSALEDLSGSRYAAVLVLGNKILGTGAYVITYEAEKVAHFKPNPHSRIDGLFDEATVVVAQATEAKSLVEKGELDVFYTFGRHWFEGCETNFFVRCLAGPETSHQSLDVNGLSGRFFSNSEHRKALQSLVWELFSGKTPGEFGLSPGLRFDPQFYLPFQAGRLPDDEVLNLVKQKSTALEEFKSATQSRPLKIITGRDNKKIIDALRNSGLNLTADSGIVPFKESLEDYYQRHSADIIVGGFSVWNGDPDGAYHVLGTNGAITSPMIQRPRVIGLIEEGRGLLNQEELHPHYQEVSRSILEEVPFVHIGMVSDQILYRSDKLETDEQLLARSGNVFHLFRRK